MPERSHNLSNKNTVSRGSQMKTNITNDEGMCVCVCVFKQNESYTKIIQNPEVGCVNSMIKGKSLHNH